MATEKPHCLDRLEKMVHDCWDGDMVVERKDGGLFIKATDEYERARAGLGPRNAPPAPNEASK